MDKLTAYRRGDAPLPDQQRLWHLYGAGLENMGRDGKTSEVALPECGADELIIRHDAVGLCFSDTKVIAQGQAHPRIFRDMQKEPVVLGHEIAMTIVKVGANLSSQYKVGDRMSIQPDIYVKGVNLSYGYMMQGGLSQFNVIDYHVLETDRGNMLLPLQPGMGYAESALAEPWACVVAAYRLEYRTEIKNGGTLWVIGAGGDLPYTISRGFDETSHPRRVFLTNVPVGFAAWLKARGAQLGCEIIEVPDPVDPSVESADDIILLGADPALVELVSPRLARFGVFAIVTDRPFACKVSVDVGRVHYDRWVYVGGENPDISRAYLPRVRSSLKPGGRAWFVGAGGPIGRMHVQRAIQFDNPPSAVVSSDISDMRLDELRIAFMAEALQNHIGFDCLNPTRKDQFAEGMAAYFEDGFDDIVVLAPIPAVIAEAASHAASGGVVNVFAGVGRGSMVDLDMNDTIFRGVRFIGHSGSDISDMIFTLSKTGGGELSTNRSVAAIGSLSAARDGMRALKETTFPGKIIIYPNIGEFPLTGIPELKDKLPSVYTLLVDGREWTNAAEEEFLRLMLP
jgi:threonine dehydrogenase-like Zn-dependent dehydrogenase